MAEVKQIKYGMLENQDLNGKSTNQVEYHHERNNETLDLYPSSTIFSVQAQVHE